MFHACSVSSGYVSTWLHIPCKDILSYTSMQHNTVWVVCADYQNQDCSGKQNQVLTFPFRDFCRILVRDVVHRIEFASVFESVASMAFSFASKRIFLNPAEKKVQDARAMTGKCLGHVIFFGEAGWCNETVDMFSSDLYATTVSTTMCSVITNETVMLRCSFFCSIRLPWYVGTYFRLSATVPLGTSGVFVMLSYSFWVSQFLNYIKGPTAQLPRVTLGGPHEFWSTVLQCKN